MQDLSFQGINDEVKGLRPLVWRILLNYFSLNPSEWDAKIRGNLEAYRAYCDELITKPELNYQRAEEAKTAASSVEGGIKVLKVKAGPLNHPLSKNQDSTWKRFYDDKTLWEEIEKDVKRTRVELAFFMQAIDPSRNSADDIERLER